MKRERKRMALHKDDKTWPPFYIMMICNDNDVMMIMIHDDNDKQMRLTMTNSEEIGVKNLYWIMDINNGIWLLTAPVQNNLF